MCVRVIDIDLVYWPPWSLEWWLRVSFRWVAPCRTWVSACRRPVAPKALTSGSSANCMACTWSKAPWGGAPGWCFWGFAFWFPTGQDQCPLLRKISCKLIWTYINNLHTSLGQIEIPWVHSSQDGNRVYQSMASRAIVGIGWMGLQFYTTYWKCIYKYV